MQQELFSQGAYSDEESSLKDDHGLNRLSFRKGAGMSMDKILMGLLLLVLSYVVIFSWGVERGELKTARPAQAEVLNEIRKLKTEVETLKEIVLSSSATLPADNPPARIPESRIDSHRNFSNKSFPTRSLAQPVRDLKAPTARPSVQAMGESITLVAEVVSEPSGSDGSQITGGDEDKGFTVQLVTYATESRAKKQVDTLKSQGFDAFIIPSDNYYQVCVNRFSTKLLARSALKQIQSDTGSYRDAYIRSAPAW